MIKVFPQGIPPVLKGSNVTTDKDLPSKDTSDKSIEATAATLHTTAAEAFKAKSSDFKQLASVAFDYTSKHLKDVDSSDSIHLKNLSLLFRNKVSPQTLKDLFSTQNPSFDTSTKSAMDKFLWTQIILENKLHFQFHATDIELSNDHLSLPVDGKDVKFSDIEVTENNSTRTFTINGKEIFKTDQNGKLTGYHFHGAAGILPGESNEPTLEHLHTAYLKKEPTALFHMWVCSSIDYSDEASSPEDQTYIGLEDPEGNVCFYRQNDVSGNDSWYEAMKQFALNPDTSEKPLEEPVENYMNTQGVRQITEESYNALREQFQHDLNQAHLQGPFKLVFAENIPDIIAENKPVRLNPETNRVEETKEFSETDTLLLLQKLSNYLQKAKVAPDGSLSKNDKIVLNLALKLLESLDQRISKKEISISTSSLKQEIITLDRTCALLGLKENGTDAEKLLSHFNVSDDESSREHLKEIKELFTTSLGKENFNKWCFEKTSYARKKNLDQYIMTPKAALQSFFFLPSSVNFVKELHLNRSISALNQELKLDEETGDLLVLLEGEYTPVSKIKDDFHFLQDHIINTEGEEFFYFEDTGLRKGSPTNWGDTLPLFKKKDKVRKEPHLEVCTIIGKMVHAYIKLKGVNGEVYSFGKFWDRNVDLPAYVEFTKAVPGMVRMDYHDYMPHEKDFKKTKIKLTQEKYDAILDYIKELPKSFKSQDEGFNLVNRNCNSFVHDVTKIAGVDMGNTKISAFEFLLGRITSFATLAAFPKIRKFFFRNTWLRRVSDVVLYPLTVLRNLFIYMLGSTKKIGKDNLQKSVAFRSPINDIFNPLSGSGSIEHPIGIRTWQDVQEDIAAAKSS